jgi:membrane protease YdiL (CAAX protease family)
VSLTLSLLLWVSGLIESLQRPSVAPSLDIRQAELGVLAAPALADPWRSALLGETPEIHLLEALQEQPEKNGAPRDRLLRHLLRSRHPAAGDGGAVPLPIEDPGPIGDLARRIAVRAAPPAAGPAAAGAPEVDPLVRRLACEQLGGSASACVDAGEARRAATRLLLITVLPVLLLLAGIVLLIRLVWRLWRGSAPATPPPTGPPLSVVDLILLVAGGFVVLGETLVPLVAIPLTAALTAAVGLTPPRDEAVRVVLLYLSLMALPLLMLVLMLRGRGTPPRGGWLQWGWRPPAAAAGSALAGVLMVLPLVAAVSWLAQRILGDPGGSNPLLELVLGSRDTLSLLCLAFTALVLAPLFEEVLFRGVLLPVLARTMGAAPAVLASAAVFGLAHLSLGELPPLLVLGLGLGWLRLRSGRLGPCVLMHGLWNGLTFANLVALGG